MAKIPVSLPLDNAANANDLTIITDARWETTVKFTSTQPSQRTIRAMANGRVWLSKTNDNLLIYAVGPGVAPAQMSTATGERFAVGFITFQFDGLTAAHHQLIFKTLFLDRYPTTSKLFQRTKKTVEITRDQRYSDAQAKTAIEQEFTGGELPVEILAGQAIWAVPATLKSVRMRFFSYLEKPELVPDGAKHVLDPRFVIANTVNYASVAAANQIRLQEFFLHFASAVSQKNDAKIRLRFTHKGKVIKDLELFWANKDRNRDHLISKTGPDLYSISAQNRARYDGTTNYMRPHLSKGDFEASVEFPHSLAQSEAVYASLGAKRNEVNGYALFGRISTFPGPNRKMFRITGKKYRDLINPLSSDQLWEVPIGDHRFRTGTITVYGPTPSNGGWGPVKKRMISMTVKSLAPRQANQRLIFTTNQTGQCRYKIFDNGSQGKVSFAYLDKIEGEVEDVPQYFNNLNMPLSQFLIKKDHELFAGPFSVEIQLMGRMIRSGQPQLLPVRFSTSRAQTFIRHSQDPPSQKFGIPPSKDRVVFDLSDTLKFSSRKTLELRVWAQPSPLPTGSGAMIDPMEATVTGAESAKAFQKIERHIVNGVFLKSKALFALRKFQDFKLFTLQIRLLHQGKQVTSAGLKVELKKGANGIPLTITTDRKGELQLYHHHPINWNEWSVRVPAFEYGGQTVKESRWKLSGGIRISRFVSLIRLGGTQRVHVQMGIKKPNNNQSHPLGAFPVSLFGKKRVNNKITRQILATGETNKEGYCGLIVTPRSEAWAMGAELYMIVEAKGKTFPEIGTIKHVLSTEGILPLRTKNASIHIRNWKKYSGTGVGTKANPVRLDFNQTREIDIRFHSGAISKGLNQAKLPPSLKFSMVGTRTHQVYGTGRTKLNGKLEYSMSHFNPDEPIYISLVAIGTSGSKATFSWQHRDPNSLLSMATVEVMAHGIKGVKSDPFKAIDGLPEGASLFIDYGGASFVLHTYKVLFEVNAWMQHITSGGYSKGAPGWSSQSKLSVYFYQGKGLASQPDSSIELYKQADMWSRRTMAHEYGHFIHRNTSGIPYYWVFNHIYQMIGNPKSAITEGWAGFLGEYFSSSHQIKYYSDHPEKFLVAQYKKVTDPKTGKFKLKRVGNAQKLGQSNTPKNLGEKVEGAFAILLWRLMTMYLGKSLATLGPGNEADIRKHKSLRAFNYLIDHAAVDDFNRLIWYPFYQSGGTTSGFIKALRKSAHENELAQINTWLKELSMGQP